MAKPFALVISISKKSLSTSGNVMWLIRLIQVASRCIFAYLSWLVVDLKSLMKQLRKSRGVSRLKVYSFLLYSISYSLLDLKASLFENVSKRIPEAFDDAKTARRHIVTAANSGQAFTAEDICDKHKDVKSMTVKEVIAKFVAANILSNVGKGYVFHSNLEKSYFRENFK